MTIPIGGGDCVARFWGNGSVCLAQEKRMELWTRRRPERWFGLLAMAETWVLVAAALGFACTFRRKRAA